ncbi:putative nuclease HARBI1 [Daphnia pulex]|uniref:putative nuclease HARBI1 n=1 Tax=Daphnia pulex TaxID=6669 RepID=UPI001EE13E66|nr:putative nuclease HARBI1 [Daphnia pulex]
MNNIDEFERHIDVLNEVLNSDIDSDANEDELYEQRIEVRRRMVPFYRQRADIFDLFDDNQIYKVFRFDKASIWYIEGLISDKLGRKLFGQRCLLPIEQILVSLQFYANGTFQSTVGNVLKISQSSVSRCVRDVSKALCDIASDHIFFPDNLLEIQLGFTDIANLRGVVGSVDGTHIRIARPHLNEEIYVNRKGYHSINVQGICDAECNFLSVSASKPGSSHDANVFADSAIGQAFKNNEFGQSYLLGDSGYACTPFLLTPYSQPQGRAEVYRFLSFV